MTNHSFALLLSLNGKPGAIRRCAGASAVSVVHTQAHDKRKITHLFSAKGKLSVNLAFHGQNQYNYARDCGLKKRAGHHRGIKKVKYPWADKHSFSTFQIPGLFQKAQTGQTEPPRAHSTSISRPSELKL
jgi:hypothetical protein